MYVYIYMYVLNLFPVCLIVYVLVFIVYMFVIFIYILYIFVYIYNIYIHVQWKDTFQISFIHSHFEDMFDSEICL